METVEKSAEIFMRVEATGKKRLSTMTKKNIAQIAKEFDLKDFNKKFISR
jgi:hypothetical protein